MNKIKALKPLAEQSCQEMLAELAGDDTITAFVIVMWDKDDIVTTSYNEKGSNDIATASIVMADHAIMRMKGEA